MIEEATFLVRAKLTVRIDFSPIERETPITERDAIANARGTMSDDFWAALEDEGWDIQFFADRVEP